MTFFAFPKVKWLQLTVEVDKSVRSSCQIFSGLNLPKLLKSVNFWQSYSKKKKVDFLGDTEYVGVRLIFPPRRRSV